MRDLGLVMADERRVGTDRLDEDAGGEEVAFNIEDIPAARFKLKFLLCVLLSFFAEFVVPDDLEIDQAVAQPGERRRQDNGEHQQAPVLQSLRHIVCGSREHQPLAATGSSSNGNTSGGKSLFTFVGFANRSRAIGSSSNDVASGGKSVKNCSRVFREPGFLWRHGLFGRWFSQTPDLRRQRLYQTQILDALFQVCRRAPFRELLLQLLIQHFEIGQALLALFDLFPELEKLIHLPDIAYPAPANEQAKKKC